jgi:XTP/dITP diphosphohydrolase
MSKKQNASKAFEELLHIMDTLREKCPWDQKQTFQSLKPLTIEEVYELIDAISENKPKEIKSELGDLLLHIVFYAKIASEQKLFDIADVIESINKKLIFRHPHIYSNAKAETEDEVKKNWEKLKLEEGKESVLDGVPNSLPAIIKAYRIQDKVKGVGFEFPNNEAILDKIKEEIDEFHLEMDLIKKEEEFGDILFSLVNYARFNGINPESALEKTNKKFIARFREIESIAKENNQKMGEIETDILENYWNQAKKRIDTKS